MPDATRQGTAAAASLRATTAELIAEVQRLPEDLINWIPAEGVWTVMDNLCHVREFVPFWTSQVVQVAARPDEPWGRVPTDTARMDAVTNTARHRLDDVLVDIDRAVAAASAALISLSDADLAKEAASRNPRWGVKPASFIVDELIVGHVAKHLGQIRRNTGQFQSARAPRVFLAPPSPVIPVRGRDEVVPIHRIFCVGRNYEAHAREMGVAVDREAPFYFTKAAHHYVSSGSTVPYPPGTDNYHHEIELVVVIGRPSFRVTSERALDNVFGYACGLDMTRRDLQFAAREQRRPWDLAKDVEQSAVISPIVPASEAAPVHSGAIELRVNGEVRQQANLSLLIHGVPEIIAHLSSFYHLQPGDVIFTGTPEGVGPVNPGDRLDGRIAGVGEISLIIGAAS